RPARQVHHTPSWRRRAEPPLSWRLCSSPRPFWPRACASVRLPPLRFARPPSRALCSRLSFVLPCSVYRLVLIGLILLDEGGVLHQRSEVVQRNTSVDLHECSFDYVFQLSGAQRS